MIKSNVKNWGWTTNIQIEIEVQFSLSIHTGDWFQGPYKYQKSKDVQVFYIKCIHGLCICEFNQPWIHNL